jgi:epoxyqueuosine reductase
MHSFIRNMIVELVNQSQTQTTYRTPLVGMTAADNPGFARLKELVGPGHLLPHDLLPEARTVVAFFVPFSEELIRQHRQAADITREWAVAYIETNQLISSICSTLVEELQQKGVKAAWQQPTHNFDATLIANWSHKHVAYFCGLGTFGLNQMLITAAGCAGRIGGLVVDIELPSTPVPSREYCLHRREGKCAVCTRLCPTEALRQEGFDKAKCYQQLLKINDYFADLGLCDVCGKCAVGPCALTIPGTTKASHSK